MVPEVEGLHFRVRTPAQPVDHQVTDMLAEPPSRVVLLMTSRRSWDIGSSRDATSVVEVKGEYNHGYTGVLKNALDWTFVEWNRKPVSVVGWGNVGGARAIEQLREVSVQLELAPLRHAVHILPPQLMAVRESGSADDLAPLDPRLDLLAADLEWWADALRAVRQPVGSSSA